MTPVTLRMAGYSIKFDLKSTVLAGGLLAFIGFVLLVSVAKGSYALSYSQVFAVLTGLNFDAALDPMISTVIWELRLPRALGACLVGILLGLSGALLQTITRNPLVDPSLVGISQGATLAVVTLMICFVSVPLGWQPFAGFTGALLVAFIVMRLAEKKRQMASLRFILMGVGISAGVSAVTTALLTYGQINQASAALLWLAGSVHGVTWPIVAWLFAGIIVALPCLTLLSRPLALLRFGEPVALTLGARVEPVKRWGIVLAVVLAALAVSFTGPIGFIGLVAPQLALRLKPHSFVGHLVLSALMGACLVAMADLLGRLLFAPIQIPAGVVTAVLGAPLLMVLLIKGAKS